MQRLIQKGKEEQAKMDREAREGNEHGVVEEVPRS